MNEKNKTYENVQIFSKTEWKAVKTWATRQVYEFVQNSLSRLNIKVYEIVQNTKPETPKKTFKHVIYQQVKNTSVSSPWINKQKWYISKMALIVPPTYVC
ncbi:hypothetical protein ND16A_1913 [Thalassotalea sp. ND16A]|nr:hypothetical protein ND16A_1913 [Thalassotalea sp. ND16A]